MPRSWPSRSSIAALLTTVALLAVACEGAIEPIGESPAGESGSPAAGRGQSAENFDSAAAAAMGDGFLVWESNRSGAWRIWTRRLDGSGLRQLTPDEAGGQHCCAQISPDGERVAYLSLPGQGKEYVGPTDTGVLRLIGTDGSGDRELVASARTYHESRAVVWRSGAELIHLTGDGRTALLAVDSGESELLVEQPAEEFGWLIDPTLGHATLGLPSFSPFDPQRRRVDARQTVAGCQAYFSGDGRWGYWTAGAGGPIHRIDLASREVTTLLRKNDPRLPADRGYVYFPMASDDGRLFAVGASRGRHDHFQADYEIFVFAAEPETLDLVGPAVRFTFDPAVDRFPDVWAEPLALGDHVGEAPFEARLEAGPGEWSWDLGDGAQTTGSSVVHRYETAGTFVVTATLDEVVRTGRVRVAPAAPPEVARVELRQGGRQVHVWLDEPIASSGVEARFESGLEVAGVAVAVDGRSIVVDLGTALERPDRLVLTGLVDRAQQPNVAPSISIAVDPPLWPTEESDLVLLWQTAASANLVRDRSAGVDRAPTLKANGRATLDHAFAMRLAGGTFDADAESAKLLTEGLQGANEMSLELTVTVAESSDDAANHRIVSLGDSRPGEMVLSQRGDELVFRTRARRNRTREWSPPIGLFDLETGRPTHLVVTYRPGQLRAYRDGELVVESADVQGDFFHWQPGPLTFGGDWRGALEGVAIYARVLDSEEVAENAVRYRALRAERPEVRHTVVEATRLGSAAPPRLADISPYREALVIADYRVDRVLSGEPLGAGEIRVAEWAILGGVELSPAAERAVLTLERFADNPQLEGVVLGGAPGGASGDDRSRLYYAVP